eukprot:4235464-Lingulodinium_polyedra.AAC.1
MPRPGVLVLSIRIWAASGLVGTCTCFARPLSGSRSLSPPSVFARIKYDDVHWVCEPLDDAYDAHA